MSKTPDLSAMFKDVMGAFPVDTKAFDEAFKTSATLNEKLSSVALKNVGHGQSESRSRRLRQSDDRFCKAQQKAFMKAMTGGLANPSGWNSKDEADSEEAAEEPGEDLDSIKQQLSELQDKLSKLK